MVDTLRADHMSAYGYDRTTTPFISRFAAQGTLFEHARSQASCTFPSVNSLLTSRYPNIFYRQPKGDMGIPDEIPSVAEILKDRGYRTIAVSASPIVRSTPSQFNLTGGFDRGFDLFLESTGWRHGGKANRHIVNQIDNIEEPFFLYAHYMDPHDRYDPPQQYQRRFAGDYKGHPFIKFGNPNPIASMLYADGPELDLADDDIQHLVDLYDDEIRYFDGVMQRLIKRFEERGLLDRTVIVFTSDHGEEFLEHGQIKHCRGVWDTVTRVPLIFSIPGVEGGARVEAAVQNLDVVPTILDYLGVPADGMGLEGRSLRPLIEGESPTQSFAFSGQRQHRSADDGRYHLIFDGETGDMSLFDLRTDPGELNDLYAPDHPRAVQLRSTIDAWLQTTGQDFTFAEDVAAAKAKEEELRALGYLQ